MFLTTVGGMDRWIDRRTDRQTDGQTEGWIKGRTDGQTNQTKPAQVFFFLKMMKASQLVKNLFLLEMCKYPEVPQSSIKNFKY